MLRALHNLPELQEAIKRSHDRSREYGVDPNLDGASESLRLSEQALNAHRASLEPFYSIARERIDTLYELLAGTGFCMALTDNTGYILYVVGDAELIEHFKRRRCVPGYRWTERDVGTCAIGLALAERIPVFIPGECMYSNYVHQISNAGSPIFVPESEEILGTIVISGKTENMNFHTLGLVQLTAETVTSQLLERLRNREMAIKHQYMQALLESDSRGIITVNHDGHIVHANSKALMLLALPPKYEGLAFEEVIGEKIPINRYLKSGKGFTSREVHMRRSSVTHYASLDPIQIENKEIVGGLFTIFEKKEMMRMAVEMTGTQPHFTFDAILGKSERIQEALRMAQKAAESEASVLLVGETGTGKELFAQSIHNHGERHSRPFVAINCGAIPKELLESELFGYEEGAFTGAQRGGRPGKLELADGGTLFLDEIGDMPFEMQVKLLRVLQSGEVQRVGSLQTIQVSLRVIAATNKQLEEAIGRQEFREDLYYRISTFHITIPSLRERDGDVLLLAQYFIQRLESRRNKSIAPLPQSTIDLLQHYSWPGNIRQLESAVERAVHLTENNVLLPEHFGLGMVLPPLNIDDVTCIRTIREMEQQLIAQTLHYCAGNIKKTAELLGISRPTLYRKIDEYKL